MPVSLCFGMEQKQFGTVGVKMAFLLGESLQVRKNCHDHKFME